MDLKSIGVSLFNKSLKAISSETLVKNSVYRDQNLMLVENRKYVLSKNVFIIGFGKAVPGMAHGITALLTDHIVSGIICVPHGAKENISLPDHIEVLKGAKNNIPDQKAVENSLRIKDFIQSLSATDILIVLVSGGGSALLSLPVEEVGLADKLLTINTITNAGGNIKELNTVRKILSQLKGGKLLQLCNAGKVISFIISDIVGDPINYIASGPTVLDQSTPEECYEVFKKLKIDDKIPKSVKEYLQSTNLEHSCINLKKALPEYCNVIIGSNKIITKKICNLLSEDGFHPVVLTNEITGEAATVGKHFADMLYSLLNTADTKVTLSSEKDSQIHCPFLKENVTFEKKKRFCLVSSGETTVTVKGTGKGGRNQEMALAFLLQLQNLFSNNKIEDSLQFLFMSCGTDGQDGPTIANGGVIDQNILRFVISENIDLKEFLDNNSSNDFFNSSEFLKGYLHITGLTGTNVMDVQLLMVCLD